MAIGLLYHGLRDTTATYATNFLNLIPIVAFIFSTIAWYDLLYGSGFYKVLDLNLRVKLVGITNKIGRYYFELIQTITSLVRAIKIIIHAKQG